MVYLLSHSAVEITGGKGSSNVRNHRWLLFIYRCVITFWGHGDVSVFTATSERTNFYMLDSSLLSSIVLKEQ